MGERLLIGFVALVVLAVAATTYFFGPPRHLQPLHPSEVMMVCRGPLDAGWDDTLGSGPPAPAFPLPVADGGRVEEWRCYPAGYPDRWIIQYKYRSGQ